MVDKKELSEYQSHKKVHAVKIAAIEIKEDGSAVIAPAVPGSEAFTTKTGYKERFKGTDEDQGYFVLYEDGYESWSPSKAFEDGYTKVINNNGFKSPIMKHFAFNHLPNRLQSVSKPICNLAAEMDIALLNCAEKSTGLRKLLEAKDCFVRAALEE